MAAGLDDVLLIQLILIQLIQLRFKLCRLIRSVISLRD